MTCGHEIANGAIRCEARTSHSTVVPTATTACSVRTGGIQRKGRAWARTDLDERERDLGVPLLRSLEDEVVERLSDFVILSVVRVCRHSRARLGIGVGMSVSVVLCNIRVSVVELHRAVGPVLDGDLAGIRYRRWPCMLAVVVHSLEGLQVGPVRHLPLLGHGIHAQRKDVVNLIVLNLLSVWQLGEQVCMQLFWAASHKLERAVGLLHPHAFVEVAKTSTKTRS